MTTSMMPKNDYSLISSLITISMSISLVMSVSNGVFVYE